MTTLADTLLAHSRTLGMTEPRRDGTVSLSIILAADMATAMRTASGLIESLEMERDAARRAAR